MQKFLQERFVPLRSQIFWERPTPLMETFGITWTPTFIVHDPDGREHHRFVGYVPSDDLIAQLGLGLGKILLDRGELAAAAEQFRTVVDRHPNAGATPEAIFLLGAARFKALHDPRELRQVYDTLVSRYPNSEWARRAEPYSAIPPGP